MKTLRNMITVATLATGLTVGTVSMAGADSAPAPAATTAAQVTAFWTFLNSLQQHVGMCEAIRQSASGQAHQVVYGGNCLQAFLVALDSGGAIAWEYIDGPVDGSTPF